MLEKTRPVTAIELLNMPDDGCRYELVEGELRKMPPAGGQHGKATMRVSGPLWSYVQTNNLGEVFAAETGFLLAADPDTVRAPDSSFIRRERLAGTENMTGYWPLAPDLAVEVISPNDNYAGVAEKVRAWLAAGTQMVIVVNPRPQYRTVTVHQPGQSPTTLKEQDTLNGGEVVPGWRLPVREIFS